MHFNHEELMLMMLYNTGNRLSLTLTMFQNGDNPIRLSAITAGGSQAVFFKINTIGEESFLDDVKNLLEEILEE